ALLKREAGLEGSQAGTSLTSLFSMFVTHKDQLKKLGQQTGVKFELFDKKGQFLGWENMFKQAEQLQELPAEKRMIVLNKAFGEQGAKAFNAFVEAGVAGWKNVTAEAAKAVPVNDKINAQMETYNAKMEAVMGSIENLTATAFTPMLGTLKPVLDLTNNIVGSLQGFAKENPAVAGIAGHLMGIGSAALVGYAGVKALTTSFKLMRIASAVGSNEAAILRTLGIGAAQSPLQSSLSNVFGGSQIVVGKEIDKSGRVWSDKMRGVGSRIGGMLLTGFAVGAPLFMFERYMEGLSESKAAEQHAFEAGERLGEMIREGMKKQIEGKLTDVALVELRKVRAVEEAKPRVEKLGLGESASKTGFFGRASEMNTLLAMAMGQKYYREHGYQNQLLNTTGLTYTGTKGDEQAAAEQVRDKLYAESYAYPEQLIEVLKEAKTKLQQAGDPEMFPLFKRLAEDVYPQWRAQIESLDGPMQKVVSASDAVATSFFRLSRITPPQMFFTPGVQYPSSTVNRGVFGRSKSEFHFDKLNPPKLSSGGYIEREGLVHIHSGERVVPAAKVRREDSGVASIRPQHIHLHLHIPKGSRAAEEPQIFGEVAVGKVTTAMRNQRRRS
ncbi:MAG: phage tail tape measure protein, partial [Blastocatellia bacterium]